MKGDAQIITLLNKVLKNELTAINQYFLHARIYKHWGFGEIGRVEYKQSIRTMKEADDVIERILFLEGLPNLQDLGKLLIGEDVAECIDCDLRHEKSHHQLLVQAIANCEAAHDYVSRELLDDLLEHCESAIDWLETQQTLIKDVGLQNYLQSQMKGADA
ncbi:bacterioferritin [Noviherbaspirillum sp. ST9]|uniref:bacterioferritin n=1 Tax=Noviherbaspirillum sp. ST9 TaxID=3401606 RepID=UPI003B58B1F5